MNFLILKLEAFGRIMLWLGEYFQNGVPSGIVPIAFSRISRDTEFLRFASVFYVKDDPTSAGDLLNLRFRVLPFFLNFSSISFTLR